MRHRTVALLSLVLFGTGFLLLLAVIGDRARVNAETRRALTFLELDSNLYAMPLAAAFVSQTGLGGQVITNPTTATFLTVPAGATHAWITVKANPACWGANQDGTAPTASSGGEWPAGFVWKVENDRPFLQRVRVINCTEGATVVKVYYMRDVRATE